MSAILLRPEELSSRPSDINSFQPELDSICREVDAPAPEKLVLFSVVAVLTIVAMMLGWQYVVVVAAGLAGKMALTRYDATHE